jgi:hypothetical protein
MEYGPPPPFEESHAMKEKDTNATKKACTKGKDSWLYSGV